MVLTNYNVISIYCPLLVRHDMLGCAFGHWHSQQYIHLVHLAFSCWLGLSNISILSSSNILISNTIRHYKKIPDT